LTVPPRISPGTTRKGGAVEEHTKTTRSDIGGKHDGGSTRLELGKNPVSLSLLSNISQDLDTTWANLLVTVNGECGPAIGSKELGQVVGDSLGSNENKNLGIFARDVLEVLEEFVSLVVLGTDLDDLLDVVVSSQLERTNVDLDKVTLEVLGESLNLLGPGRREQEGLSVGSDLRDDLSDLGLETHVQHPIGFVHDQVGNSLEVGSTRLEHIDKSTRSGDTDLDTLREVSDLRTLGGTTVDGSVPDSGRLAELGALLLDLDSKFSGRSKNEDNGSITSSEERLSVDVNHGGESERDGLSGTSLGNGDDISTRESHGPSLTLNGGRSGETHSSDLGHDILGETSLVEGADGSGDVLTSDLHLLLGSESIDLLLRTVGDSRVLDVEAVCQLMITL
jgi:hypothetical protein